VVVVVVRREDDNDVRSMFTIVSHELKRVKEEDEE
jgi:hypothetical protein